MLHRYAVSGHSDDNTNANDNAGFLVWVQFRVGETNIGEPDKVDGSGNVDDLKKDVKAKYSNTLKHVNAALLLVHAPISSDPDEAKVPLRPSKIIADCGITTSSDDNPFIVQVPPGVLVEALLPAQQQLQHEESHQQQQQQP